MNNFSLEEFAVPTEKPGMEVYRIIIPCFGVTITFVNLFVVISSGIIIKKDLQPRTTYLFLGNIALCDMVTGIAVLFGHFTKPYMKQEMVCVLGVGLMLTPALTSIYSVMLIAIDRYLFILYGIKYKIFMYPCRARFLILTAWALGLFVGFLPSLGWNTSDLINKECWLILMAPLGILIFVNLIGIIPIVVIIILYSRILCRALKTVGELRRASNKSNNSSSNNSSNSSDLRFFKGGKVENGSDGSSQKIPREPTQWKACTIVLLTTGSSVVTWVPYFVITSIMRQCPLYSPLAIIGFANSLINPMIYAWWHNGFRSTTLKQLKCCYGCKNKKNDVMISTKG